MAWFVVHGRMLVSAFWKGFGERLQGRLYWFFMCCSACTQGRWSVALSIYSYFNRFHLQVGKLWCDTCGSWCCQRRFGGMGQESETWVPLLAFSESHCFNLPRIVLNNKYIASGVTTSDFSVSTTSNLVASAVASIGSVASKHSELDDLRPEDAALQALCGSLGFVDLLHTEATLQLMTSDIPTSCFTIDLASPPCQTKEFVVSGLGFLVQGMEAEINVGCLRYPLSFTTGRWVLGLGDVVIIVKSWCYQIHAFWLVVHVPFASFCTCLSRNPSHFSPGFSGRWENTHANTTILSLQNNQHNLGDISLGHTWTFALRCSCCTAMDHTILQWWSQFESQTIIPGKSD